MWPIACSGSKAGIGCQIWPRPVHLSCPRVESPRGFDINSDSLRTRLSTQCGLVDMPPPLTVFKRTGLDVVRTFRRASDSRNASSITAVSVLPDSAACLLAWARRCSSSRTVVRMHQSIHDAHHICQMSDRRIDSLATTEFAGRPLGHCPATRGRFTQPLVSVSRNSPKSASRTTAAIPQCPDFLPPRR